ncbi:formimidoylglutamase [Algoriphagus sediminis]|uniref:Formimidoylglutamase n=1 Tax=Algoriphagus sediminis TaxID=3057113 RepID=A0ABT7YEA5_9BACT|nr:formimidoylglutamase [Algoriphagus sediminis]MDN3204861.1 formimidoylglutamase [Algoriphagus sediminis]
MRIDSFFEPVDEFLWQTKYSDSSFFEQIHIYRESFPDLKGVHVALIGLKETRGYKGGESIERGSIEIREKLYQLKRGVNSYRVADLGNLILGDSLEETYSRMQQVGEYLMKRQILPVYFGGTHDLDYGQYMSYENLDKLVTMLNVDSSFDLEENESKAAGHVQDIILHQPNFLFSYAQIGHQSFLVDPKLLGVLEKLSFDHLRLGQLRDNFQEAEPLIREADFLSFDLSAIQSSDAPGALNPQPFGLTGEEACQIAWFAGTNEKLSSFGIYGYDPYQDDMHNKTAKIVAVMIWYFLEGFYSRKDSLSFESSDYVKYRVALDNKPNELVFYKSKKSGKWWIEIPQQEGYPYDRIQTIACSYSDYELAQTGEIPERWVNAQIKYL